MNGGDPRAIGVFDSGLGGLTVGRAIMDRLPDESLIYFGDTARVPYGPKSPDTVRRYSREIGQFLLGEGVKAIVVACNTATAHGLAALRAELPIPVLGVIEPGARAAVAAAPSGRIGVVGTAGTIRSGAYERAIRELSPEAKIVSQACPLFVPLVEEGWTTHEAARIVAREYLTPLQEEGVDALVLGCTHYPHLKTVIREALGSGVRLVDSAVETADELARVLDQRGLRAASGAEARHRFIASDDPRQFLRLGARFLGHPIENVEIRTLG
ncbi:MAG TPA: glutamate racemase [Gemmatimonadaceae bacterium]|nr:glutamate racemase [Gemmatimonadaceae bacterium]